MNVNIRPAIRKFISFFEQLNIKPKKALDVKGFVFEAPDENAPTPFAFGQQSGSQVGTSVGDTGVGNSSSVYNEAMYNQLLFGDVTTGGDRALRLALKSHKHSEYLQRGEIADKTYLLNYSKHFATREHTHPGYISKRPDGIVEIDDALTLNNVSADNLSKQQHTHPEYSQKTFTNTADVQTNVTEIVEDLSQGTLDSGMNVAGNILTIEASFSSEVNYEQFTEVPAESQWSYYNVSSVEVADNKLKFVPLISSSYDDLVPKGVEYRMNFGTLDFQIETALEFEAKNENMGSITVNLINSAGKCVLRVGNFDTLDTSLGRLRAYINGAPFGSAVATTPVQVKIVRVGGLVSIYINNTLVASNRPFTEDIRKIVFSVQHYSPTGEPIILPQNPSTTGGPSTPEEPVSTPPQPQLAFSLYYYALIDYLKITYGGADLQYTWTRISPEYPISLLTNPNSSRISWIYDSDNPESTIQVFTSIHDGTDWLGWKQCTNGGQIPDVNLQTVNWDNAKIQIKQVITIPRGSSPTYYATLRNSVLRIENPIMIDVGNFSTMDKAKNIVATVDGVELVVKPDKLIAQIGHQHVQFLSLNEMATKAKKLSGKRPTELSDVQHNHDDVYVQRTTTAYKSKKAVAPKSLTVGGRELHIIQGKVNTSSVDRTMSFSNYNLIGSSELSTITGIPEQEWKDMLKSTKLTATGVGVCDADLNLVYNNGNNRITEFVVMFVNSETAKKLEPTLRRAAVNLDATSGNVTDPSPITTSVKFYNSVTSAETRGNNTAQDYKVTEYTANTFYIGITSPTSTGIISAVDTLYYTIGIMFALSITLISQFFSAIWNSIAKAIAAPFNNARGWPFVGGLAGSVADTLYSLCIIPMGVIKVPSTNAGVVPVVFVQKWTKDSPTHWLVADKEYGKTIIAQNVYTVTNKQTISYPKAALSVRMTVGGLTSNLDVTTNAYFKTFMARYPIPMSSTVSPSLSLYERPFDPTKFKISVGTTGTKIVVTNNGFPYTLVAMCK